MYLLFVGEKFQTKVEKMKLAHQLSELVKSVTEVTQDDQNSWPLVSDRPRYSAILSLWSAGGRQQEISDQCVGYNEQFAADLKHSCDKEYE